MGAKNPDKDTLNDQEVKNTEITSVIRSPDVTTNKISPEVAYGATDKLDLGETNDNVDVMNMLANEE